MPYQRDFRIDIVKGLCILLMVYGHLPRLGAWRETLEAINDYIYLFHMPIFALITGFLFGAKSGRWGEVRNVFNRMFKPYLFGSIMLLLLYYVAGHFGLVTSVGVPAKTFWGALSLIIQGHPGGAIWYLYSLGLMELLVLYALWSFRALKGNVADEGIWVLVFTITFSCLLRVITSGIRVDLLPYFLIGFYMRRRGWELPSYCWMGIMVVGCSFIIDSLTGFEVTLARVALVLSMFSVFMWMAHGVVSNASSRVVKRIRFMLEFCGRHTMSLLLFHGIVSVAFRPLSFVILRFEPSGLCAAFIMLVLIVFTCFLLEAMIKKTPLRGCFFE